jgi:hypothetical protein
MTKIQDNTFAAACYDMNSIADLEAALVEGPDEIDMTAWNLTPHEWEQQIKLAITAKREDAAR